MADNLLAHAAEFAIRAHGDQKRKYTGAPYWHHLREVATTLIQYGASMDIVAAGWLHDTIEDTPVKFKELVAVFGLSISTMVLEVTDVSRPEHGNRELRKALDRQYVAGASWRGQMVKCADMLSNTSDILANDLNFAKVYIPEKRKLIDALHGARTVQYPIWRACFDSVVKAEKVIERDTEAV